MERRKNEKVEEILTKQLNVFQACNEFQLSGLKRRHVMKKFKDDVHSANGWTRLFREQRIL
jgi:hypothetical protein